MNELQVKPIMDQAVASKVIEAAKENHHLLLQPTHYFRKNGEIVGAINLAQLPAVHFWMHSEKTQVRDSLIAINVCENILRANGKEIVLLLNKPGSSFESLISRIGYSQLDTMTLNYKLLND